MKKSVSVIIPAYNCGGLNITRAVNSAVFQAAIEQVIVVDDGSTDDTPEALDKLSRCYDKLVVIHKSNGGVSSARNRALDEVRCDYVSFLDADDELDSHFADRALEIISASNADLVIGSYEYRKLDGSCDRFGNFEVDDYALIRNEEIHYLLASLFDETQMIKIGLKPMRYTANWSMMISSSMIGDLRFDENITISEDRLFNYNLFMRCSAVAITGDRFYIYNQTEGSASQKYRPLAVEEMTATASAIGRLPTLENVDLCSAVTSGIVECFEQAILFSVRNIEPKDKLSQFGLRLGVVRQLMSSQIFIEAIVSWTPHRKKDTLIRHFALRKNACLLLVFFDIWDLIKLLKGKFKSFGTGVFL